MHIEKSIIMKNYLVTNDYFKTTLPMIKYVTSLPIPLRLCKLSKSNPNLQLSYCKNRGLIHAISLIGKYKGFQSRKSAYKRGIDYLYHALNNDDNNHFHVSKTEIKRLMRPGNKKKHCLVIPLHTIEILQSIVNYIDFPCNSICKKECKAMREYCKQKYNITGNTCFGYLIKELRDQLLLLEGEMRRGCVIHNITSVLKNETNTPNCN